MSREVILIPKARYERLMNQEELKESKKLQNQNDDSVKSEEPMQMENNMIKNGNIIDNKLQTQNKNVGENGGLINNEFGKININNKETDLQGKKDPSLLLKKGKKKGKSDENRQNGGGKDYVKMSPNQFLNHKNKKLTLKKKWLSFPI